MLYCVAMISDVHSCFGVWRLSQTGINQVFLILVCIIPVVLIQDE